MSRTKDTATGSHSHATELKSGLCLQPKALFHDNILNMSSDVHPSWWISTQFHINCNQGLMLTEVASTASWLTTEHLFGCKQGGRNKWRVHSICSLKVKGGGLVSGVETSGQVSEPSPLQLRQTKTSNKQRTFLMPQFQPRHSNSSFSSD